MRTHSRTPSTSLPPSDPILWAAAVKGIIAYKITLHRLDPDVVRRVKSQLFNRYLKAKAQLVNLANGRVMRGDGVMIDARYGRSRVYILSSLR